MLYTHLLFASPGPNILQVNFILQWYELLIAYTALIGVILLTYLAGKRGINLNEIRDLAIRCLLATAPSSLLYYVLFKENSYKQIDFTLRWYGLLIASAVLIGVNLSIYLAKKRNIDGNSIGDLAIWLVLAAIPGARLYYVLFKWDYYSTHLNELASIWQGGIAIHGAILGGLLATIIFAKIKQLNFWDLTDIVAPSVILGQAIGRWGNFFNSEAFGSPTNLPWKLYIPSNRRPSEFQNQDYFHPTFLYESVWNLGVFGILIFLFFRSLKSRQPLRNGSLFMIYLILYSLGRVWIEGLRTDSLMMGGLKTAQLISFIGVVAGSLGLAWLYKSKPKVSIDS